MPSTQLDEAKKAMSAIRAEFTSEVAKIRTSNLYSDGGRRAE